MSGVAAAQRPAAATATSRAEAGRRAAVSAFIAIAFAQNDADAARQQWRRVADQLRPRLPKLAAPMDEAESDVLAYMSFPAQHRAKLHSTDPLERLSGEIRRRTEVVGPHPLRGFDPQRSRHHPPGRRLLLEQNDEWVVQRSRYMALETIAPLSDDPIVKLPAVAARSNRPTRPESTIPPPLLHHVSGTRSFRASQSFHESRRRTSPVGCARSEGSGAPARRSM